MKLYINILLLAVFAVFTSAAGSPHKQVIVSYPADTPPSVLEEAMATIRKAGGVITHEFHLIMGFAAEVTEETLDTVQALGASNNVLIEEDQIVNTNKD